VAFFCDTVYIHCVLKNVSTFLMISWTRTVRLQRFLAHSLLRLKAIDRCFYFSTSSISCSYFTSGNCQDLDIMKISQKNVILVKNLYLSKQYGARSVEWIARPGLKTWKHRQSSDSLLKRSHKTDTVVTQPGSGRPRSSHSSGGPCAQSAGQAKKASVSSWDFVWNCHSLFKCTNTGKWFTVTSSSHASNDVVFSCCLKPIVSPVSLADKQPYRLQ